MTLTCAHAFPVTRTALVCCIFTLFCFTGFSQELATVRGGFFSDSIKIGETTRFYLSAHYGDSLNVLFPDSTAKFSPFEFERKEYFPTITKNGVSIDSAVYYLSTFEVDRKQQLSLPVYILVDKDSTTFTSLPDTILIQQMVTDIPDTVSAVNLPLKMNTTYHPVDYQFNYWILIIAGAVLAIIALVVWLAFGKRIAQYLRAKRLKRKHNEFVAAYEKLVQQLQGNFSANLAENTLSFWKKYMERLERYPFTKMTTRETLRLTKDEMLANNLRQIDRAIYSDQATAVTPFQELRSFADLRFNKKLQEVQHGK